MRKVNIGPPSSVKIKPTSCIISKFHFKIPVKESITFVM